MIGIGVIVQVSSLLLLLLLPPPALSLTQSHGLPLLARLPHHHQLPLMPKHHLANPTSPVAPPPPPPPPPPSPPSSPPSPAPPPILHAAPHYKHEFDVPTNYHFTYRVADSYSGDVHHHTESKTDYTTKGQYSVKLPDGRTQVVTYTADDDGYHAQVEYHGDITHHPHSHLPTPDYHHSQPPPPPPPPVDYPQHPPPPPPAKPLKIYKYSPVAKPPAGPPPLLPKLFVPQDPPKLRKPPPALKLEKAGPHSPHLAGVVRARQYSYSPTPYPAHQVRTPIYKGKIVFVDKP